MTSFDAKHFNVLSANSVEAIRGTALRTLERVGAMVSDPNVRDLLNDAGAKVAGDMAQLAQSKRPS